MIGVSVRMRWLRVCLNAVGMVGLLLGAVWARAQSSSESAAGPRAAVAPQSAVSPDAAGTSQTGDGESVPGKAKRKGGRQAEGTEAPNKFEADPVVKSRYMLEGRTLEVDPD